MLLVAFTSCEEDIKFNNPAVQALKDNERWKATQFSAERGANDVLTIKATNGFETLTLKTTDILPGEYPLGIGEGNKASYVLSADGVEMAFQTGTGIGDGLIEISSDPRETDVTRGFISGKFRFNAFSANDSVVNFRNGVFYKVPITVTVPAAPGQQ